MSVSVSTNQLASMVVKACLGAGVIRGVANEVGEAVVQLSASPEYLADTLVELTNALAGDAKATQPALSYEGDDVVLDNVQSLHHGPSVVDLAVVQRGRGSLRIGQVDNPRLLDIFIRTAPYEGEMTIVGSGANVRFSAEKRKLDRLPQRAEVDGAVWVKLTEFAHQTMVPDDAASLADAGAGTTDND